MSDLVGDPEDRFYRAAAHIIQDMWITICCSCSHRGGGAGRGGVI